MTELLRQGARVLIEKAVEAELSVFLEPFSSRKMARAHAPVVRNGYHPERQIQTGIGSVSVKVPKTRSKSGEPVTFRSTLGCKGFARVDEEGFTERVHITPANKGESPEFARMIAGAKAQRVLADKAYASKANREMLIGKHRDGIMHKAARNRPLRALEKRFNKLISRRRFRDGQSLGTMKRLFGLARARYFGVEKVHAQMVISAISANLLKAANKITLNPIGRAIT